MRGQRVAFILKNSWQLVIPVFSLLASVTSRRHDRFQYVAVFHVAVVLRNDQTPTRVVDKVFQVVEGGQKLLTDHDLLFVDLDIDTRPEDIR